jgi:peptidoglycan/xylan/chitin deacetylase (PgdA/CDA1 family)
VLLTADDRELWAPRPPDRSVVPVLLYHRVAPKAFARQMALLDHAGYETITLEEFVRLIRREQVRLPPRPLLLTFDGGRADSWIGSDAILAELGFNAVVFVDVGRVNAEKQAEYLTWKELDALQRGGRWEVQLQSGAGHHEIQYGPAPEDVRSVLRLPRVGGTDRRLARASVLGHHLGGRSSYPPMWPDIGLWRSRRRMATTAKPERTTLASRGSCCARSAKKSFTSCSGTQSSSESIRRRAREIPRA